MNIYFLEGQEAVKSSWKLPNTGAENQTWLLCKSSTCSKHRAISHALFFKSKKERHTDSNSIITVMCPSLTVN